MTQAQQLADLSQAYTFGALSFRNRVTNSMFRVRTRGQDFTVGSGGVTQGQIVVDGWHLNASAGGRAYFDQSGCSLYRESGSGSVSIYGRLETIDWLDFIGQPITLSMEVMRFATGSVTFSANVITTDGETDLVNGKTVVTGGIVNTANSKWEKLILTGTVPANTTQKGMYVELIANNVGTAGAGQGCAVRNVQLEVGTIATPYEYRPYALEALLCMRRYEQNYVANFGFPGNGADPYRNWTVNFMVPKRIVPAVTVSLASGSFSVGTLGVNGFTGNTNLGNTNVSVQMTGWVANAEL